jgi:hypothetical protein
VTGKRRAGVAVIALGVCVAAGGVAGLVLNRGAATPVASTSSGASLSPSAGASASATPVPVETPEQFLAQLAQAMRGGDASFMLARLHPAVIARFGEAACRAAVAKLTDATAAFIVISVGPPAPYVYTTGTTSTTVPGTLPVTVDRTRQGVIMESTVHLTPVGSQLRWFTDCAPS